MNYFTTLFTEEGDPQFFDVLQDIFLELRSSDWNFLTRTYTIIEIDKVIKEMGALKAPSPDGFQALFY